MRNQGIALALFASLLTVGRVRADANLVTNGGFEVPGVNANEPAGWTYTPGGDRFNPPLHSIQANNSAIAHSGEWYYDFDNDEPGGRNVTLGGQPAPIDTITQNVPTTPGAQYTLSYYASDYDPAGGVPQLRDFYATWDGQDVGGAGPHTETPPPDGYTLITTTVTGGPGTSTSLSFSGYKLSSVFLLDDVSVTPVPEPTGTASLLVGLGVLLWRRRAGKA